LDRNFCTHQAPANWLIIAFVPPGKLKGGQDGFFMSYLTTVYQLLGLCRVKVYERMLVYVRRTGNDFEGIGHGLFQDATAYFALR
jgi:hypothetical protein